MKLISLHTHIFYEDWYEDVSEECNEEPASRISNYSM